MKIVEDENQVFDRRSLLLTGLGGLAFALIGARMAQLQLINGEQLRGAAESNRFNLKVEPAPRGPIYDRLGVPIAINRRDFRVLVTPEDLDDRPRTIEALSRLLAFDPAGQARLTRDIAQGPKWRPVLAAENLSWEQYAAVEVRAVGLPGVSAEMGEARSYPRGEPFAHLVGFVAKASEAEAKDDPLLKNPGIRIGKEGLEKQQEMGLRGRHGALKLEMDGHGRVLREFRDPRLDPIGGQDMVLTVDAELQQVAFDQFAGEAGAAVVMDVRNGDLIVMTSAPAFDPNKFVSGIGRADFAALLNDEYRPLYHKAVRGAYPPGSTFKMTTALAALDAGVITPEERISCRGVSFLGSARFHCWKRGGHGMVDLHHAIKTSCDCYFYEVARRAGPDAIARVARVLGLGQAYDIGIPGVGRGNVPDTAYKQERFKARWSAADSFNYGIGQGYMLATPLQLAVMTARVANGGFAVEPRLIRQGPGAKPDPKPVPLDINPDHMALVHAGMIAVSNDAGGTARADIGVPGVLIAGKTGTSQVRRITMAERARGVSRNEDLPWARRDHALFVAYGPIEAPKYACAVIVEHGGGGSKAAAPRARAILKEVFLRDPATKPVFTPPRADQTATTQSPAQGQPT